MNSIVSTSSLSCLPSLYDNPTPYKHLSNFSSTNHQLSSFSIKSTFSSPKSTTCAATPIEGTVSVINFEDFVEKDWSFLDADDDSKVLISTGSEGFVDQVVETCSCKQLLVVHDSLFVLACIKEKYDKVKCWQGELIFVPEKWAPFDVVFLYFLPGLPFELNQVFDALSKVCSPGARIVISHPKGREMLEQQKAENPDVVVSDLPDKSTLESVASHQPFTMVDFVDHQGFYLAVLEHTK
ncbi:hypothetical protein L1987_86646 [Smallanthus sonchifolius]|uniref:Uncharacterized protein n=1 Tax=Smallanthus sonchifolius TaxID=185202 RepID=A0ACB8Y0R5_9ASTR|nr:hypothetical protein L1987_86646 [Smallanthus sonchifolius]